MENQSNPRTSKNQRSLKFGDKRKNSIESYFSLHFEGRDLSDSNLLQVKKYNDSLNPKKLNASLSSSFDKNSKLFKKIIKQERKSKSPFSLKENIFSELQKVFNNSNTLNQLPEVLINLPFFSAFRSCQILIHEKGKKFATNINHTRPQNSADKIIPVKNFNSLFNLIKKSKNKNFNQSQILLEDIEVLGNFLAREFALRDYNIILILSRNDFLPIPAMDLFSFNEFSDLLKSIFEFILKRDSFYITKNLIKKVLKNISLPLAIENEVGSLFFKNELFSQSDFATEKLLRVKLPGDFTLILYHEDPNTLSADIQHVHRISLLGELLNTLQHELSNPLFGLDLASGLLATEFDDERKDFLVEISNNSKRCQKIIKNFASLYQGDHSFQNFDLVHILNETLTLTKSETKRIKKEINISKEANENPIILSSNPTWVTQIIFNLLINASQAIKQNRLEESGLIKISLVKENSFFKISISDNGVGIEDEFKDKVFVPFFTTKKKGTGLGLSICKNLAEKLGGNIKLKDNKSTPGTTFELYLPVTSESP